MPREASTGMTKAMRMVMAGVTPYMAAKRASVALSTMYRSRFYELHQAGQHEELERALAEAETRLPRLIAAMRQVQANTATPWAAANANGVPRATMYTSWLYKLHKAGKCEELECELTKLESLLSATEKP